METSKQRGFTLIELMIVVAIIGVLAAIAIPMFMAQAGKARTTEAMLQLNMLAKSAKTYYQANTKFPQGTAAALPAADGSACNGTSRKLAVTNDWVNDATWSELDFHIDEPNLFTYHYTSSAASVATAYAVGDLDCDKQLVTYTLQLTTPSGTPAATIVQPTTPD